MNDEDTSANDMISDDLLLHPDNESVNQQLQQQIQEQQQQLQHQLHHQQQQAQQPPPPEDETSTATTQQQQQHALVHHHLTQQQQQQQQHIGMDGNAAVSESEQDTMVHEHHHQHQHHPHHGVHHPHHHPHQHHHHMHPHAQHQHQHHMESQEHHHHHHTMHHPHHHHQAGGEVGMEDEEALAAHHQQQQQQQQPHDNESTAVSANNGVVAANDPSKMMAPSIGYLPQYFPSHPMMRAPPQYMMFVHPAHAAHAAHAAAAGGGPQGARAPPPPPQPHATAAGMYMSPTGMQFAAPPPRAIPLPKHHHHAPPPPPSHHHHHHPHAHHHPHPQYPYPATIHHPSHNIYLTNAAAAAAAAAAYGTPYALPGGHQMPTYQTAPPPPPPQPPQSSPAAEHHQHHAQHAMAHHHHHPGAAHVHTGVIGTPSSSSSSASSSSSSSLSNGNNDAMSPTIDSPSSKTPKKRSRSSKAVAPPPLPPPGSALTSSTTAPTGIISTSGVAAATSNVTASSLILNGAPNVMNNNVNVNGNGGNNNVNSSGMNGSNGNMNNGNMNGGVGGSANSKVKKKNRQRAVRHNWTQEQDDLLIKAINSKQYSENGEKIRWTKISQEVFQNKLTPQSVYQRYMRVLNPKLNTKEWTANDDEKLTHLFNEIGDQWALIAKKLNGMKADVWIRQRAVRLGLITDGSSSNKQAGSSPVDKKSRKRKSPTGRNKRIEKHMFEIVPNIREKIATDEALRIAASQFIVSETVPTKKPRKGAEPQKKAPEKLNDENGLLRITTSNSPTDEGNDDTVSQHQQQQQQATTAHLYLRRSRSKRLPKTLPSLDDLFVSCQTARNSKKYLTVKINHASILQCFESGVENEKLRIDVSAGLHFGLKNNNICVSSYRTQILSDPLASERELIVQFPVNLISMYATLQDKTQSASTELPERKIFICVSLKRAFEKPDEELKSEEEARSEIDISSYVNRFEKFDYGENFNAYHLFTGGSIEGLFLSSPHCLEPLSQLHPITLNISFSDVLYQEDRDIHAFSNTDFKFLDNVKDMRYLVLLVNKLNQFGEGAQFMNLQWDMNCPFCNDYTVPPETDPQQDAELFEGLKQHLTQDHGCQFRCEFWNKSDQVDHFYIVATQLTNAPYLPNANFRQSYVPAEGDENAAGEDSESKRRRLIFLDNEVAQAENSAYGNITETTNYLNTVLMSDPEHFRMAATLVESWNTFVLDCLKEGYLKSYEQLPSTIAQFVSQYKDVIMDKNHSDVLLEHLSMLLQHNMLYEQQVNELREMIAQKPVYAHQDYNDFSAQMHNVPQMPGHHHPHHPHHHHHHQLMGHPMAHPLHLSHFSHLHMQHPQHLQQMQMQHTYPGHYLAAAAAAAAQDHLQYGQAQVGQPQTTDPNEAAAAQYQSHMMMYGAGGAGGEEEQPDQPIEGGDEMGDDVVSGQEQQQQQ